jgi:hypothetical protein
MDQAQLQVLHDIVLHTLAELGMPDADWSLVDQFVLQRDQKHFGRRFEFQGIRAVWFPDRAMIDFFDEHGHFLTTAPVPTPAQIRPAAA